MHNLWPGSYLQDLLVDVYGLIVLGTNYGSRFNWSWHNQMVVTETQFEFFMSQWEHHRPRLERLLREYNFDTCGQWKHYRYYVMLQNIEEDLAQRCSAYYMKLCQICPITGQILNNSPIPELAEFLREHNNEANHKTRC